MNASVLASKLLKGARSALLQRTLGKAFLFAALLAPTASWAHGTTTPASAAKEPGLCELLDKIQNATVNSVLPELKKTEAIFAGLNGRNPNCAFPIPRPGDRAAFFEAEYNRQDCALLNNSETDPATRQRAEMALKDELQHLSPLPLNDSSLGCKRPTSPKTEQADLIYAAGLASRLLARGVDLDGESAGPDARTADMGGARPKAATSALQTIVFPPQRLSPMLAPMLAPLPASLLAPASAPASASAVTSSANAALP